MAKVHTSAKLVLTAWTPANLYTLLNAVDTDCPIRAAHLTLAAHLGNVQSVWLGDSGISCTGAGQRYGTLLQPWTTNGGLMSQVQFIARANIFTLKDIQVLATTSSQAVAVEVWTI